MEQETLNFYQIFTRNYSVEGNFSAIKKDLERIKRLGVDVIYLTPINEIGIKERKGTWGSPYASKDYLSISEDLGNKEELIDLINEVHNFGMKIIIDMVFNHTAPDSVLLEERPEYYFYRDGKLGNRVGDWSDIVDLDTKREDTQDYLVSVLKYWKDVGFDGYRFDVCSMVNFNVFLKARKVLGNELIFVGESIEKSFAEYLIQSGYDATFDDEYEGIMDYLYNYHAINHLKNYVQGQDKDGLKKYLEQYQKDLEAGSKIQRLNCLENHDLDRINSYFSNELVLKNVVAINALLKGASFIYAGQEYGNKHKPELFEKDPVQWDYSQIDLYEFYKCLNVLKKVKEYHDYNHLDLEWFDNDTALKMTLRKDDDISLIGLFTLDGNKHTFPIDNGYYSEYIKKELIQVKNNKLTSQNPLILFKI